MRRLAGFVLAFPLLLSVSAAWGQTGPAPVLAQPLPGASAASPAEETPGFQPIRPVVDTPEPAQTALPPPVPAPVPVPVAAPPVAAPPPPVVSPPAVAPTAVLAVSGAADWISAALVVLGAAVASLSGIFAVISMQGRETGRRRRATVAMLALELEARRQAFEAVPVPPNAEAGVSFVSSVVALARQDHAWQAAQPSLYLLPEKLAGHLQVHYAAVHRVGDFVKGQSIAASLRMLQANRMGGHPCPDPATMREAHVELAAAFRGVDKIVMGLKAAG